MHFRVARQHKFRFECHGALSCFFPSIKHCLRSVNRKWKRLFTFGETQIKENSKHKWLEILAGKFCVRYKDDFVKSRFNFIHFTVTLAGLKKIVSYIKDFVERRWRKTKLPMDRQLFIDQCRAVNNLICSSKKSHYTSVINDNQSDYKFLFKTIDNLLHRKCDTPYPSCNSPSELANTFVEFFSDKITRIRVDLDAAAPIHSVPKVNGVYYSNRWRNPHLCYETIFQIMWSWPSSRCHKKRSGHTATILYFTVIWPNALSIKSCQATPLLKKPSLDHT